MPRGVDLLLPVERQMIAVFGDDDLREQSWCGDAALLQRVERRDDGRLITPHILPADDAAAIRGMTVAAENGMFFHKMSRARGLASHSIR